MSIFLLGLGGLVVGFLIAMDKGLTYIMLYTCCFTRDSFTFMIFSFSGYKLSLILSITFGFHSTSYLVRIFVNQASRSGER